MRPQGLEPVEVQLAVSISLQLVDLPTSSVVPPSSCAHDCYYPTSPPYPARRHLHPFFCRTKPSTSELTLSAHLRLSLPTDFFPQGLFIATLIAEVQGFDNLLGGRNMQTEVRFVYVPSNPR